LNEQNLSCAFVPREYAAEALVPHDFAFACGREVGTQNLIPDLFSLMRSVMIIVCQPLPVDLVELIKAQAKENGLRSKR